MEETTLTGDQHLSCKDTDDGITWRPHHYWEKVLVILDGERDSKGRGNCLRAILRWACQIQLLSQEQRADAPTYRSSDPFHESISRSTYCQWTRHSLRASALRWEVSTAAGYTDGRSLV
ncbi:hypothetical protein BDN67DRAFT_974692 [Paxillus ammoniavirescens]|nr:hypothetical protein BDN67DRAFT_974692 [Paxillus ammoniavirescens]